MEPKKGWFSIIQYCPDPNRLEAANVGVLLFCPAARFLDAIISNDNRRIRKFFGNLNDERKVINTFKQGLHDRLAFERERIADHSQLSEFVDRRANQIRISPPRSIRVLDPNEQLEALFNNLVAGEVAAAAEPANETIGKKLTASLEQPHIQQKLYRSIAVTVPVDGRELNAPYGYQNGRFNLIEPVQFHAQDPLPKAYRYAVHGDSIYKTEHEEHGNLKLVIVGSFMDASAETKHTVENVLGEHHVSLFDTSELDKLVEEIASTGKDRP